MSRFDCLNFGTIMKLDIQRHGRYEVITVEDDLAVINDLSELKFIVNGYIQQGRRHIVISFKNASYIYSGALGILVDCHRQLAGLPDGGLYVIESNQQMRNVFDVLGLDGVVKIYDSVADLPVSEEDYEYSRKRSSGFQSVV